MPQLKTPGVYVKETSTLPPSVAEVSTAIPVFLGYTEKTPDKVNGLPKPIKINSMLEYDETFGGTFIDTYNVTINADGIEDVTPPDASYLMVPSLKFYFNNGGGTCYIVSLGEYDANKVFTKSDFEDALTALEKEDEPTLIMLTDAINLSAADYHDLGQQALKQCADLKDRFCILDVLNVDDDGSEMKTDDAVSAFRNGIGNNNLMYGASYYPYLKTTLTHPFNDVSVKITGYSDQIGEHLTGENGIGFFYRGATADSPKVEVVTSAEVALKITVVMADGGTPAKITVSLKTGETEATVKSIKEAWTAVTGQGLFDVRALGNGSDIISPLAETALSYAGGNVVLKDLKYDQAALYNEIKAQLSLVRMIMPPSAAIAGIYANTDRNLGVWKAPANIGVASVIEPIQKINNRAQENLNVDVNSGKSVNVIRSFTGRGVLVWGGRTLLGNDNEWRYINVRRLFNMVEESIQKSTAFAVFQPNTPITWLKVRAMIESYLEDLWKAGGLVGGTKEQAYFVNIGLGNTMTQQDILEGKMNVDVGLAASRPAEFIVLNFTHKLQES